ncbi:G1/S-specific cyclin Pcl5, putative [Penicillium digitatum PHI26]|uniref:G1/S-specific cyclin Pcl5, putative n=2 Tax=Penicillium digitatum TaxID=36651 RepID=K9G1P9_PEND2|nr:G1/S-specific cyclin Pcl5, putative [Penicillium digitatum Pd1]EKV10008.1 G1/S-specific cyclin Pcl5, putative [Penicillium digitatum Pd1]EKV15264.1 G1/S-specific cyclin Pcl5, putative [Penicillium digitatum PHI26]
MTASHHAHPYASSISSSASSSSSSVFSLDCVSSQSSISSTSTNPVDVIWENESNSQLAGRNPNGACPRAFTKGPASKGDGVVPPELRMHPRRTNSYSSSAPSARPPPCLLRQSERKVNFVDNLVDTASQIVETIWPLSAAAARSDAATGSKGVLPLRTFIQETLRRSRTSYSTLQVALYYLIKIKAHVPTHDFTKEQYRDQSPSRAMQCGRRMFLAALILASKYLQDRNYSARAWSKISGLNTLEINQNELMFLKAVGWRLHIDEATFQRWTDLVLKLTPGAGGPPVAKGQCWQTVLPRLTPELDFVESEPVVPVSAMVGMDLGLPEYLSPRSLPSNELVRSLPRERTPTYARSLPRTLEPTPRMEFANLALPSVPRPTMLPTPQMTPQSQVSSTPAASVSAYNPRRPSICSAMSQAQNASMARSTLDQRPPQSFSSRTQTYDGYPAAARRSSLARSTSSASSPDSMVSDVSTLSSRSSRSSSVSSNASGTSGSAPARLAVKATLRCTSNSLKESRKSLAINSPINESCLVGVYSSPEYPSSMGSSVPDLSNFSLDSSLSEAAQSLCELSGATPERRQCRKRGRTGSDDLLLQNHVRHLINLGASGDHSVLSDEQFPHSFMMQHGSSTPPVRTGPVSGPAGMKRACCGSEARKIALNPSLRVAEYSN